MMGRYREMNAEAIVQRARELGITLIVVGDRIRYTPKSITPDDLVEELREHKPEVMSYLRQIGQIQGLPDVLDWASHLAEDNITLSSPVRYVEVQPRTVTTCRVSWYATHYLGEIAYSRLEQGNEGWGIFEPSWWQEREQEALNALTNLRNAMTSKRETT
jgi:hypothetical protein